MFCILLPLDARQVDDDSVIACLPGKGCKNHAGLPATSAQSSMATSTLQIICCHSCQYQLILWLLLRRRRMTMTQNSWQLCIVHQEILQHQATVHQEISHKVAQPYSTTNGCRNGCNLSSGVCLMKGGWACPKTRDSGKSVPSKQAGKGNTPSLNLWLL